MFFEIFLDQIRKTYLGNFFQGKKIQKMHFEIFIQGQKWKSGGRKETQRMEREKFDEVWINDILLFWALSCFMT
jgi:hypothetical protein